MKLEEVKELFQSSEISQVNTKLKDGWELLKIAPTKVKGNDYDLIGQMYILGRKNE
jgi:hypothetical protein